MAAPLAEASTGAIGPLVLDSRDGRGYVPAQSRSCPTASEETGQKLG